MTRPRLRLGPHLAPGIVAVALFGVFAAVILQSNIGDPAGFPDVGMTSEIGYSLLNLHEELGHESISSEGFLVSFLLIALVLDAAVDGAYHLARREEDGEIVSALRSGGDSE